MKFPHGAVPLSSHSPSFKPQAYNAACLVIGTLKNCFCQNENSHCPEKTRFLSCFIKQTKYLKLWEKRGLKDIRAKAIREAEKWMLDHMRFTDGLGCNLPRNDVRAHGDGCAGSTSVTIQISLKPCTNWKASFSNERTPYNFNRVYPQFGILPLRCSH